MKFVTKSIIRLIFTIFFITVISFFLIKISPIDPATAYARRVFITSDEGIEELREEMGLNQPVTKQYISWWENVIKGNFGESLITSNSVSREIKNAMTYTSKIVLMAIIIQALGSIFFAVVAFLSKYRLIGKVMSKVYIVAISIPPFIIAEFILEILAVKLRIINISTNEGIFRFLPAAISLSISGIAYFGKILYDSLEKQMSSDSVFYLKTMGISEKQIIMKYALYPSIWSVFPTFMQMMGMCFAGTMIVERVFGLPGMGDLLINSVLYRDAPMIHGIILCLGVIMAIFMILADLLRKENRGSEM